MSIDIKKIDENKLKELKENVKQLNDIRQQKMIKYKLWDIVVVTILAVLSNCDDWEEIADFAVAEYDFLRKFLKLTGGVPKSATYERVIAIVDSNELNKIFNNFVSDINVPYNHNYKDILSIDGKVDTGSKRKETFGDKVSPLNVLNVYSDRLQMSIEQEMIDSKTNEITAIPIVLDKLDLTNVICTWDALNTQKETVKKVIEKNGDYVIALKKNHLTFYTEIELYFDDSNLDIIRSGFKGSYLTHNEKSHSNYILYEYFQIEDVKWFQDINDWKGLKSIGLVKKTIENAKGEITIEKRYYISSLLCDIRSFSDAIRKHWNVENKLHWQLDFTFKCDDNTTQNKKALFNLQLIKKLCLKLLNIVKTTYNNKSLKRIRKEIARNVSEEITKIFKKVKNTKIM